MNRESGEQVGGELARGWERVRWPAVLTLLALFGLLGLTAHRTDAFAADVRFTLWLQQHDWRLLRWGTEATNWSMSGTPLTIGGLAVVLFLLLRGWRLDAALLSLAIVVRSINSGLKWLIESPRPTSDLVEVIDDAEHYGFPSGHASGALLVIGTISWIAAGHVDSRAGRAAIWAVGLAWIALTGIARVRVGVHWPSDVLGSWLWGTAVLIALTWGAAKIRSRTGEAARGTARTGG